MRKSLLTLVSGAALSFLAACGGGNITGAQVTPPPSVTVSESAQTINAGQSVTLTWSTTNAMSCTASANPSENDWSGTQMTSGSRSVTPADNGTITYTLMCTGTGGSASGVVSLTVNAPTNLTITSPPPPPGTITEPYGSLHAIKGYAGVFRGFFFLLISNGPGAPSWSWAAAPGSSLPPGLSCCQLTLVQQFPARSRYIVRGAIYGLPTLPGSYNVIVAASLSPAAEQTTATYTIVINPPPPPVVNATPPPAIATLNSPYVGFTFTATEGLPPYTWSESGPLPPGMMLSPGGVLSGTPTSAGSFPIALVAEDALQEQSAPQNFSIQVLAKGFAPTGSMATPREYHTATLLNTGKVLVAGGGTDTAELFDPTAGTFSPTGSMESVRIYHTATLLQNGKVLVAGGFGGPNQINLATAEIFDPASGTFTPTGGMAAARGNHTATLLNDGRVLVAGGLDATGTEIATAEVFDPTSGTFSSVGSMETPRVFHTATLSNTGKVLVVGGVETTQTALATAELFDSTSGTFSPTGNMTIPIFLHTATLLPGGKVLIAGGDTNGGNTTAAELFDPTAGTFTNIGSMVFTRALHTATLLNNGTALVAGGLDLNQNVVSSAELFTPASGTFAQTADMTAPRAAHAATLLSDGTVLVTGGHDQNGNSLATAEIYQ